MCLQPLAKMFKYAYYNTAKDATFAFFAVVWIVTRHGIFFFIYKSVTTDMWELLSEETHWDPANGAYVVWFPFL